MGVGVSEGPQSENLEASQLIGMERVQAQVQHHSRLRRRSWGQGPHQGNTRLALGT